MKLALSFLFLINIAFAGGPITSASYPSHWWDKVPDSQRQGSWEILPHECKKGEVILSKRNELGVFSNFALIPFTLDGVKYNSIEGLWQGMKFPEASDANDIRNTFSSYPYTREAVYLLDGFVAKKAGDDANKINKANGIDWVSYQGMKFNYKDHATGSDIHYKIMFSAIEAKVHQNPKVKALLLKIKGLILKPDHYQEENRPKSYFYHQILMDIRDSI